MSSQKARRTKAEDKKHAPWKKQSKFAFYNVLGNRHLEYDFLFSKIVIIIYHSKTFICPLTFHIRCITVACIPNSIGINVSAVGNRVIWSLTIVPVLMVLRKHRFTCSPEKFTINNNIHKADVPVS